MAIRVKPCEHFWVYQPVTDLMKCVKCDRLVTYSHFDKILRRKEK